MTYFRWLVLAMGLCTTTFATSQPVMLLSSASIVDGNVLKPHACRAHGGNDMSVHLQIKSIPPEAKFISIVVDDPDAVAVVGKVWVHWNLFNIPADRELVIPAGAPPSGDMGRASGNSLAYEGMCPPNGTHIYRFAVFATKEKIKVAGFFGPTPMTINYFTSKYEFDIVAKALIEGKF